MKLKQKSLVNRILFIIIITAVFVCTAITITGTSLIYSATEEGIQDEIESAAGTLKNLFEKEYPGKLTCDGYIYRFGETAVTAEDFYRIADYIACDDDVDFTVFYGDTRIFSTIVNENGSSAVGTKAADKVVAEVIKNQNEYFYRRVEVSGTTYMGYYIPLMSGHDVIGMYFAGKSVERADDNVNHAINIFIIISLVVLICSLTTSMIMTEKIVRDLVDIKKYITGIANGDFTVQMKENIINRDDEIGDIGKHAQILCSNLRDMVERDPLTMLLNRRSCRSKLDELIENGIPYTAVMADIDYFKNINDTYGHACGDFVLKEISALLKKYAGSNEAFAARWGGEEFLMILPQKTASETKLIAEAVLDEIRSTSFSFEGKNINVTLTLGIAEAGADETADITVNRADSHLYQGKESGRNRIVM